MKIKQFKYIAILLLSVLLICFVSCPDNSTNVASFKDYKYFEFQREVEIDPSTTPNTFVVVLNGYKFSDAVTSGSSVLSDGLSWITSPSDTGLKFNIESINQDKTEATVAITGTPTKVLNAASIEGQIAKEHLIDNDGNAPSATSIINTKASKININHAASAKLYTDKMSIAGEKGEKLDGFYDFTIYANNTSFKAMTASTLDISKWFDVDESLGLKFALRDSVTAGAKSIVVSVTSDALAKSYSGDFGKITIPANLLSVGANMSVDTEGLTIDITDAKPTWKLYDLASFGTVDLQFKSPNQGLTKNEDGSEIDFQGSLIAKGNTNTVKYEKGLSRRGYKLKGFAVPGEDGNIDVNNVTYPVASYNIKTGIGITPSQDSIVKVYAVWEVDPEAWGWTLKSDGTYQKTYDISGYDEKTGKNAYFPATFNLKDSGIAEDAQANYENYPYYREAKILAKGLKSPSKANVATDYTDLADTTFDYDFAIGEQVVTGYMLDVLRTWNVGTKGDGSDAKGYELPDMATLATAPTTEAVGYGSYYDSAYKALNDKSNPLTFVTFLQGLVMSNAFTEYYNEKHTESGFVPLTYAYQNSDGTPVKTIAQATALVTATPKAGDVIFDKKATGFRLPTDEEWTLASRIVPESNYDSTLTGAHTGVNVTAVRNYLYPQITRNDMYSGATEISTEASVATLYCWYTGNSGDDGGGTNISTHGFLTTKVGNAQGGTVLDKKPNNIGVYGMSGNVWEWADKNSNGSYRRLRGGSFYNYASISRVGFLSNISASARYGNFGLRLARGL